MLTFISNTILTTQDIVKQDKKKLFKMKGIQKFKTDTAHLNNTFSKFRKRNLIKYSIYTDDHKL